jgi:hypothetical protein
MLPMSPYSLIEHSVHSTDAYIDDKLISSHPDDCVGVKVEEE